mgnify:CR=1 FL=1
MITDTYTWQKRIISCLYIEEIIKDVAETLGIPYEDAMSKSRKRDIMDVRGLSIKMFIDIGNSELNMGRLFGYTIIKNHFNYGCHATAIGAYNRYTGLIESKDKQILEKWELCYPIYEKHKKMYLQRLRSEPLKRDEFYVEG